MTSLRSAFNPSHIWQRVRSGLRQFLTIRDGLTLFLLGIILFMPALALYAAEWPLNLGILLPICVLSLFFGFHLARSHYNELFALILSSVYGLATVLIVAAIAEPGDLIEGASSVIGRILAWLYALFTGGINQDDLIFTLLVSLLFWFLGFNAAWYTFRIDRLGRVVLPPALILITNLVIHTGEPLDIYLGIFLFAALVLLVRSHLAAREWEWYVNGIRVPTRLRAQFLRAGAMLAIIALLAAWVVPSSNLQERLDNFQEFLRSDPVRQLAELWNRLLTPIEAEGPATTDYYGSDSLDLSGAIRLGDQVVMLVDVPFDDTRYYWRSRIFENYSGGEWRHSAVFRVPDLVSPIEITLDREIVGAARRPVEQTYTVGTNGSRLIYTLPQPTSIDLTGRIDLSWTDEPNRTLMNISVIRPERVLERGTSYTVTSLVSEATATQLRSAGTNYPDWIVNPNAINPVGAVSPLVAQKAREIVTEAGAITPYDQAKAIETWLRTNIEYNERIPQPPAGIDPVAWFLFEIRQGYCTYYATSMITMLRSLGIPARMAAGFSQGEWSAEQGMYVVRERDAHTWVEVFFPGYGWVEFEPTAAQLPIVREGDEAPEQPQQPVVPPPTSTPTATPTPTMIPSPTPESSGTPPPDEQDNQNQLPPTITPTPSPSPTATPVIVPTVAPPIEPPRPSSFLNVLISAIGFALLVLLLVVLLILLLVFIWWWWEWRGMRGLNPVVRAYARLERYMVLVGLRPMPQETPEERRRRIVRDLPVAERPVSAITRGYIEERYSQRREGTLEGVQNAEVAEQAWPEARRTILGRWLSRFNPFKRRR